MFCSLDRIDIELQADAAGRRRILQTDHRSAAEIEQQPELSVLFALIRILNPARITEPGSPAPIVTYHMQEPPPEFLRRAIRAAGAHLTIDKPMQTILEKAEPPALQEVIESAFVNMARAVAVEFQTTATIEGLEIVERALADSAGNPAENELSYWSAVAKLGSFAGEVIRTANGGSWTLVKSGSLPFALSTPFNKELATVNPLGKAIKRFANGDEDSLITLVKLILSQP